MIKAYQSRYSSGIFPRKQGNILGVGITGTSRKQLLIKISKYLQKSGRFKADSASKKPLFITTPNSEQLALAYTDPKFKEILGRSDVTLCDGVGLLAAYEYYFRLRSQNNTKENLFKKRQFSKRNNKITTEQFNNGYKKQYIIIKIVKYFLSLYFVLMHGRSSDGLKVIKGREFTIDLIKIANERRYKVFLLGSTRRILTKTLNRLSKEYPAVRFKTYRGAKYDTNSVPLTDRDIRHNKKSLRLINRFQPHMLFVAYGAPKQEKWVYRNLDQLNCGLIMVVGGTFDYISDTGKSVPQIINRLGLEWLWRLLTGSQNIKRIMNAVVKFPLLVMNDSN